LSTSCSEISKNWQGVPLESYETAINYISSTETRTGLKVKAVLNSKNYETGETVTDEEIAMLRIRLYVLHAAVHTNHRCD
jgi:Rhodopirellula transposase DDE domain